jgi:hypothetical protein
LQIFFQEIVCNGKVSRVSYLTVLTKMPKYMQISEQNKVWGSLLEATKMTGIKRGKLYLMINEGTIKTASLRESGQGRGTRLVHLPALLEYIESRAEYGEVKAPKPKGAAKAKRAVKVKPVVTQQA